MLRKKLRARPSPDISDTLFAKLLATALAMSVLAAAGRAVQQHSLGRGQVVVGEERVMHERKLDGVGYLLYLGVESADVGVTDVGNLLEDEIPRPRALAAVRSADRLTRPREPRHRFVSDRLPPRRSTRRPAPSSARPNITARSPSGSSSLSVATSPVRSGRRASTTLDDSLSATWSPRSQLRNQVGMR